MKKLLALAFAFMLLISTAYAGKTMLEITESTVLYDMDGKELCTMPKGAKFDNFDVKNEGYAVVQAIEPKREMIVKNNFEVVDIDYMDNYSSVFLNKFAKLKAGAEVYELPSENSKPSINFDGKNQKMAGISYPILAQDENWTQIRVFSDVYIGYIRTKDIEVINKEELLPKCDIDGNNVICPGLYACENLSGSSAFIRQGDKEYLIKDTSCYTVYLQKGNVEFSTNLYVYRCKGEKQEWLKTGSRIFIGIQSYDTDNKYPIAMPINPINKDSKINVYSVDGEFLFSVPIISPEGELNLLNYEGNFVEFENCVLTTEEING